ncbi:hypothetical protein FRX31_016424 [Thalictrum thalictroides]|uniref:TF-B3 domain-containing protein n=1 Tax=Thalictrum thalictroides TaxID=46969 RepID=A0A7J6WAJ6_THATH|nr:hypothetical protein FRX31_016424 [Thalictrum thalictroides]
MEFSSQRSIHGHSDKGKGKMKQKHSQSLDCKEHKQNHNTFIHVMAKYNVKSPYLLPIPVKISRLLPEATVPVVLTCRNRNWMTSYTGADTNKRFDVTGWRNFATDNMLKEGDGSFFELMEWSIKLIKFKVHILDGDLPPEELFMKCDTGTTSDAPINIE